MDRQLQDTEKPEPFQLGSIKPEFITEAIDKAKNELFDYATDPFLDAFGLDKSDWIPTIESYETYADDVTKLQDKFGRFQFSKTVKHGILSLCIEPKLFILRQN